MQLFIQDRAIDPILKGEIELQRPPLIMRLVEDFPRLRRLPARLVGMGARPEHVHTRDAFENLHQT
jgi:hypothetical protein